MSIDTLVSLLFPASLFLIVLSTGMAAQPGDVTTLLRQPGLLLRSFLSMQVLAPLVAVVLAYSFHLSPAIRIALVMLAISPVPPFLPGKAKKAGGHGDYAVSLLVISGLLSIITIPLSLEVFQGILGFSLSIPAIEIAKPVAKTVLFPLVVGLILMRVAPGFSKSWSGRLAGIGMLLLLGALVPQLIEMMPAFRVLIGDGTLAVIAGFTVSALFIGHLLGGPEPEDRTVLALCTSTHHPFIAMVLAQANFPGEKLAGPAILMALIVTSLVSLPYVKLSKRRNAQSSAIAAPLQHRPAKPEP